jgi:hypothetical protein
MIRITTSVISAPIWKPTLPPAMRTTEGGLQVPSCRRTVAMPSPAVPPIRNAPFTTPGNTSTPCALARISRGMPLFWGLVTFTIS